MSNDHAEALVDPRIEDAAQQGRAAEAPPSLCSAREQWAPWLRRRSARRAADAPVVGRTQIMNALHKAILEGDDVQVRTLARSEPALVAERSPSGRSTIALAV